MAGSRHFWMLNPKSFIKLVGAEYELLRKAEGNVLQKFYLSSALIVAIAVISFLSIRYAIELMFHITIVEILLSSFLSLLFVIMYIFLINTFSDDAKAINVYNATNFIRTGFVVFLAFVISKPIEIYLFKNQLDDRVIQYKTQMLSDHSHKIEKLFYHDEIKLQSKKQFYINGNRSGIFNDEIVRIENALQALADKKVQLIKMSMLRIEKSDFFIYRIISVSKNIFSWLVCLAVIILFLIPGFLVYSMARQKKYFELKKRYEHGLISKAYQQFCINYSMIFKEKFGLTVNFYSIYEDPPFNTKLKKGHSYLSEEEFYSKYCK